LAEVADRLSADKGALHIAMAGFLDSFYSQPERRQAMIDPEPQLLGDAILDATIGGVGEYLAAVGS